MRTLKNIAFSVAFNVGALYVVIAALDDVTYTGDWLFFLITGTLIAILNLTAKPLLKFLSIPLIFMSGGLFLMAINGIILWFTDELLELLDFTNIDFQIEGIVNFLLAGIVFGATNWFEQWLFKRLK